MRRQPPANPTPLFPTETEVHLPPPVLLVDTREQDSYTFLPFKDWFADVRKQTLKTGDYTILGYEDRFVVERKSLPDLFASCNERRTKFLEECARMGEMEFAAIAIECSLSDILEPGQLYTEFHPNRVKGTLEAFAARWGIHFLFLDNPKLGEEVTACLLHKHYQLAELEKRGLPRRFRFDDV